MMVIIFFAIFLFSNCQAMDDEITLRRERSNDTLEWENVLPLADNIKNLRAFYVNLPKSGLPSQEQTQELINAKNFFLHDTKNLNGLPPPFFGMLFFASSAADVECLKQDIKQESVWSQVFKD